MAGYDEPGNNPFFLSYWEATPAPKFRGQPLKPQDPAQRVEYFINTIIPGATPHQRDSIWREIQMNGSFETFGKPDFDEKIKETVKSIAERTQEITQGFLKKARGEL